MPIGTLRKIRSDFDRRVQESFHWIREINNLAASSDAQIDRKHIYFAYEYAFLRIFTGWEKFVQGAFIGYITAKRINGHRHKSYLKRISEKRALELLTGTKEYPDWSNFDDIFRLADLFFIDPEPFKQPFLQVQTAFLDIKKIRNAIVHMSSIAIKKYEGLLRANMPRARIDMTPGEFLSTIKRDRETFWEYYISYMEAAASRIIPI